MNHDAEVIGEIRALVMDAHAGKKDQFAKAMMATRQLKIDEHKQVFETYVEDAIKRDTTRKTS